MAALTPEQQSRVEYFLEDEWVDPEDDEAITEANFEKLLNDIETPDEIHAMCAGFNWDCVDDEVDRLLAHRLSDVATVLLAYWRTGPRSFCSYRSREEIPDYRTDSWELVQRLHSLLEKRLGEKSTIGFDPTCDETARREDWTQNYLAEQVEGSAYVIPEAFHLAIEKS